MVIQFCYHVSANNLISDELQSAKRLTEAHLKELWKNVKESDAKDDKTLPSFVLDENADNDMIGTVDSSLKLKNMKTDTKLKVKKRNLDFDNIFEKENMNDEYDDYDYPPWTPVGNGRVKIMPLTFGRFCLTYITIG